MEYPGRRVAHPVALTGQTTRNTILFIETVTCQLKFTIRPFIKNHFPEYCNPILHKIPPDFPWWNTYI